MLHHMLKVPKTETCNQSNTYRCSLLCNEMGPVIKKFTFYAGKEVSLKRADPGPRLPVLESWLCLTQAG